MFTPNSAQVREFFCACHLKHREQQPLSPLEAMAADWIALHPEYHAVLGDAQAAQNLEIGPGQGNPFLHLSMHLSIAEQCSIDQPRGIRSAAERLAAQLGSLHEAHHQIMECLGQMLWQAQRSGTAPDGDAYIECVRRRASR